MSTEELSDGEVVREILGGQREMYRVLVRRYQDVLYRHAYRMVGQPDDAADIVQKTLVSGFQKLNRCRDPERVGGWLFRIAANLTCPLLRYHLLC
jgi:RNA polymerase sigma-70 factor (ECF subfamily)